MQKIFDYIMKEKNPKPLNKNLNSLIERSKSESTMPTFDDFINFFPPYIRYLQILQLQDEIIFDDLISKESKDYTSFNSIEQVCYYFFISRKKEELRNNDIFLLNSLPEYYIKRLTRFCRPLADKLIRYLYNEDISFIISDWKILCKSNPFNIYKKLMTQIKKLEKQKK